MFTCLLVRAIHLEMAPNYSTDVFLMTFPNKIYSDVGSQLVGASSELKVVYRIE